MLPSTLISKYWTTWSSVLMAIFHLQTRGYVKPLFYSWGKCCKDVNQNIEGKGPAFIALSAICHLCATMFLMMSMWWRNLEQNFLPPVDFSQDTHNRLNINILFLTTINPNPSFSSIVLKPYNEQAQKFSIDLGLPLFRSQQDVQLSDNCFAAALRSRQPLNSNSSDLKK